MRDLVDALEPGEHRSVDDELEAPGPVAQRDDPLAGSLGEVNPLPGTRGPAHQDLPLAVGVFERPHEEQLEPAAARTPAVDPRGNHPRVVQHEEIAGAEQLRKLADGAMPAGAREAIEHEQPGIAALRGRLLRHQLRRQHVVEVGQAHPKASGDSPAGIAGYADRFRQSTDP